MVTLYDATERRQSNRAFGRGIIRSLPTYRYEHTAADERWWEAQSFANWRNDDVVEADAIDWDAEFRRATEQERIEAGYPPC